MTFENCFGNNPGYDGPVADAPQTLDELLGCFDEAPEDTVWRGQACHVWPAIPTLHRRLRRSGLSDCQINEGAVSSAERRILADAIEQGLLAKDSSVLEFMARLQHYGGATRLLDVTTDYRVALYFACSSLPHAEGTVLAYRVNPASRISLAGGGESNPRDWCDLLDRCADGRLLLVVPAAYDRRIAVQHGAFLLLRLRDTLADPSPFTNQAYDVEVRHVLISPALKREVLAYLADEGITERTLFPSIESFAQRHSVDVPICLG